MVFELSDRLTELIVENASSQRCKCISFDGMKASGKDTAIKALESKGSKSGKTYSSSKNFDLRLLRLGVDHVTLTLSATDDQDPLIETMVYVANSYLALYKREIGFNKRVLLNRSYISLLAYLLQSEAAVDLQWLLGDVLRGSYTIAERSFILVSDPEQAHQRIIQRGKKPEKSETIENLARLAEAYQKLAPYIPGSELIDTTTLTRDAFIETIRQKIDDVDMSFSTRVCKPSAIEPTKEEFRQLLERHAKDTPSKRAKIIYFDGIKIGPGLEPILFQATKFASRVYWYFKDKGINCEFVDYFPPEFFDEYRQRFSSSDDYRRGWYRDRVKQLITTARTRKSSLDLSERLREKSVFIFDGSPLLSICESQDLLGLVGTSYNRDYSEVDLTFQGLMSSTGTVSLMKNSYYMPDLSVVFYEAAKTPLPEKYKPRGRHDPDELSDEYRLCTNKIERTLDVLRKLPWTMTLEWTEDEKLQDTIFSSIVERIEKVFL